MTNRTVRSKIYSPLISTPWIYKSSDGTSQPSIHITSRRVIKRCGLHDDRWNKAHFLTHQPVIQEWQGPRAMWSPRKPALFKPHHRISPHPPPPFSPARPNTRSCISVSGCLLPTGLRAASLRIENYGSVTHERSQGHTHKACRRIDPLLICDQVTTRRRKQVVESPDTFKSGAKLWTNR